MKNRRILQISLTFLLIVFFASSYSFAHYIIKNNLRLETYGSLPYLRLAAKSDNSSQTSVTISASLPKVMEGAKYIFKIKYKDIEVRNLVLEKHFNESSELIKKTQVEVDEFFKNQGYITERMSNSEIILVNNSDRYSYSANRYFLGVYEDLVTIYKTDKDGNIIAHKLFNSNIFLADGKQSKYDFVTEDVGELQYIKLEDLKEKDGLVDNLIRGKKHTKDGDGSEYMEESEEYEKWEFKTPEKAFDFAMSLLKS
ncbi:hypothetical protein LGK97_04300 [Clostridium sp. CS001]|uniref:hypothetical protein n=1 Tax=Clostridium sp. CS001 TaxID=2880648 RepID=UPI001CF59313|nr:hypothetical protein [Clostridium sp. CS001]MCB2288987.1 hypothetical protein [Clostridium sp. CS001]